ncbi:MAG: BlaI/MecI/CopY family transcriptional regulator [Phycisphaerales bacterium]|nr:BlaI/MecI/CopY family transcriptional regulator [Phycisphaerae bacterium]NNF43320.1 BlaI/MecI/CopY family transcriptional regulator [Phycisphaerales bacterium]NNM25559.1 BlaI/MecI/CopY family transcriptional regulator [Phycisphaerales bacterium]
MAPPESDLSTAELEVLKTLWDDGASTVRDVLNRLHGRGRKIAYTTVLTFLTRLEQKGYVRSDKSGVAYVYRPRISRERVTRSRLQTLLEELYDGAAAPLVLQLVRDRRFTADEIAELQSQIDELERRPRTRGKKKK